MLSGKIMSMISRIVLQRMVHSSFMRCLMGEKDSSHVGSSISGEKEKSGKDFARANTTPSLNTGMH